MKVGMGIIVGAVAGLGIGIALQNMGAWIGIGVAIGAVVGLATRAKTK